MTPLHPDLYAAARRRAHALRDEAIADAFAAVGRWIARRLQHRPAPPRPGAAGLSVAGTRIPCA
jgi:hypothetical protein